MIFRPKNIIVFHSATDGAEISFKKFLKITVGKSPNIFKWAVFCFV